MFLGWCHSRAAGGLHADADDLHHRPCHEPAKGRMAWLGRSARSWIEAGWGLFLIVIILGRHLRRYLYPDRGCCGGGGLCVLHLKLCVPRYGAAACEGRRAEPALWQKPHALLTVFFHRDARDTLFDAGKLTVTLMFIIANALILKHVLTDEQIPQQISAAMLTAGFGPIMFLVIVNVILLIGGQFMEPSGLLVIVAPLVFPIAIELGIDPIHLGIIMVVNMEIGMITPPVGLNLFVTSGVASMPMMTVVRAALPFLAVLFVFLIMVTYIPELSTWLPTLMMGPEIITK